MLKCTPYIKDMCKNINTTLFNGEEGGEGDEGGGETGGEGEDRVDKGQSM